MKQNFKNRLYGLLKKDACFWDEGKKELIDVNFEIMIKI